MSDFLMTKVPIFDSIMVLWCAFGAGKNVEKKKPVLCALFIAMGVIWAIRLGLKMAQS